MSIFNHLRRIVGIDGNGRNGRRTKRVNSDIKIILAGLEDFSDRQVTIDYLLNEHLGFSLSLGGVKARSYYLEKSVLIKEAISRLKRLFKELFLTADNILTGGDTQEYSKLSELVDEIILTNKLLSDNIPVVYRLLITNLDFKHSEIASLIEVNHDKYTFINDMIVKLKNIITADIDNLHTAHSKDSFKNLFDKYHQKLEYKFLLGNKNIHLQLRGNFDMDSRIDNIILKDVVINYYKIFNDTPIVGSLRAIRKDALYNNNKKLQDLMLIFFRETIIKMLTAEPDIIRANHVNVYVNIHAIPEESPGSYEPNSYYDNIFINIKLTDEMINYFLQGYEFMPPKTAAYVTIMHELIHSYDWIKDSDASLNMSKNKELLRAVSALINESPMIETLWYAVFINNLRMEGLAFIGSEFTSKLHKYDATITDLYNILLQSRNTELINMMSNTYVNKIPRTQLISTIRKLYDEGLFHDWGNFMVMITLISKLSSRLYFIHSKYAIPEKLRVDLGMRNIRFEDVQKVYPDVAILRAQDIWSIYSKNPNCHIYIIMFRKDKEYADLFLKKLSLTRIDKFILDYELALRELKMPELGITSNMLRNMNHTIKRRFIAEVEQAGFKWEESA